MRRGSISAPSHSNTSTLLADRAVRVDQVSHVMQALGDRMTLLAHLVGRQGYGIAAEIYLSHLNSSHPSDSINSGRSQLDWEESPVSI